MAGNLPASPLRMPDHGPRQAPRHDAATQEVIRIKAAKSVLAGKTIKEVAEIFGVSRSAVGNWSRRARQHGLDSLKSATRGRRHGEKRVLEYQQEMRIKRWVLENDPQQLGLPFKRWGSRAVMALVLQRFKIAMPHRTVQDYLYRWGLSASTLTTRSGANKSDPKR